MYAIIFLWALALIYIAFAVIQDIRTREIANWISFSLITFALGFRFFYSLFEGDGFVFFLNGVMGLGIFFVAGNLLYYGKIFAGGDAKLMIAFGAILPYFSVFSFNLQIFLNFFVIFLFVGFFYILFSSFILCVKNFKKFKGEFLQQFEKSKKIMFLALFSSVIFLAFGFFYAIFLAVAILIFFISYLYVYSKAVDESCMIMKIKTKNLREGDWLYSNLKIGKRTIKAKWEGLNKKEIKNIGKKYKEIKIRQGIPFSPVFLISLVILSAFILLKINLWNSFG
jgi:Flp pilus assembly protein protease CpaA